MIVGAGVGAVDVVGEGIGDSTAWFVESGEGVVMLRVAALLGVIRGEDCAEGGSELGWEGGSVAWDKIPDFCALATSVCARFAHCWKDSLVSLIVCVSILPNNN